MKFRRFFQAIIVAISALVQVPVGLASALSACRDAISRQEVEKGIPQDLLRAIATVESGISPWAINAKGRAHVFHSKEAAAEYVRKLVGDGFVNFSVGCMQLHYASHHRHFHSVEAMLEPENNIAHAARLIKKLKHRHGSLEKAVKFYHSASPTHHNRYQQRVYGLWGKFRGGKALKPLALKKLSSQKNASKTLNAQAGKQPNTL